MRVEYLAQEHNVMIPVRAQTQTTRSGSSKLTIRPRLTVRISISQELRRTSVNRFFFLRVSAMSNQMRRSGLGREKKAPGSRSESK